MDKLTKQQQNQYPLSTPTLDISNQAEDKFNN